MTLVDAAGRLNRLQQSRRFKIVATVVIAALAIASFAAWAVYVNAPGAAGTSTVVPPTPAEGLESSPAAASPAHSDRADGRPAPAPIGPAVDTAALRALLGSRDATVAVATAVFGAAGLAILVVWLGVGLTYLGLLLVGAAVAAPLLLFPATRGWGRALAGVTILTACFTALLQAARMLLSGDRPTIAIARNVLAEAVRMKISLVFIVMLVMMLAALPSALDEAQPLRYRVQSFLQYSVSGSFWVLALMTLFFSAATVAFEQRDRVIWQTMAKPVSPWQYLIGKWLGVAVLNATLLTVASAGVFLFTEHLRSLPANGESRPFVNADGSGEPTTDRLLLHSQVLVARAGAQPVEPAMPQERLIDAVEQIVRDARERDPSIDRDPEAFEKFRQQVAAEQLAEWRKIVRSVPPGHAGRFIFAGLQQARRRGGPMTLRYKINAGSNDPSALYRVAFRIAGTTFPAQVVLNTVQTIPFRPEAIDDDGRVIVEVFNGDPFTGQVNRWAIQFPPRDLEILYVAGGYETNFARVMAVQWVKLGFVAAVAIAAATCLSFPVACLLAMLVLFAGETAGFLAQSIESFNFRDDEGNIDLFSSAIRLGAQPVVWAFGTYASLRPTANLVDGRLVGWGGVARALLVLGAWTAGSLGVGWAIFRKRELATYSGH